MSEWERQVDKLRTQVQEIQQTLDQTANLTAEQRQNLLAGTAQIRNLVVPDDAKGLLAGVPQLLNSLFRNNSLGAAVIGQGGEWLLFNSLVRSIFGSALHGNTLRQGPDGIQFFSSEGVEMSPEQLPWQRSLRGEHVEDLDLIVKSPSQRGDIYLQVTSTPMLDGHEDSGAAVVLLIDRTEMTSVARRIRELESQMARQLELVATAEQALGKLLDKLGMQTAPPASEPKAQTEKLNGEILVVDDIPVNQRLLLLQLKKIGLKADTAINGKAAVEMALHKQYDLIFMDCDMPVMDGYDATRAIRAAELATGRHTPIVAMTSLDRESDREHCLSAGMDEYQTKGLDEDSFRDVINRYVRNKQAEPKTASCDPFTPPSIVVTQAQPPQPFDVDTLEATFGRYELEEIVSLFMGSSSTLVSCLDFAIEDKDAKAVCHFAYSLKGPAATLSMHAISRLCADITSSAESADWDGARTRYRTLRGELQSVQSKLQQFSKSDLVTSFNSGI